MPKIIVAFWFRYDNYHKKIYFLSVNTVCDKCHREKNGW